MSLEKFFAILLLIFGFASAWLAAYTSHINHWSNFMFIIQGMYGTIGGLIWTSMSNLSGLLLAYIRNLLTSFGNAWSAWRLMGMHALKL